MIRLLLLIAVIFSSTTSFAFSHIDPKEWGIDVPTPALFSQPLKHEDSAEVKHRLMNAFSSWEGTRYLWGGDSHKGIDCSAFTRRIMSTAIHKTLPRTTQDQIHMGHAVNQKQLEVGDLVFFMTKPNVRHVGVYVGHDQFMHASSSHGVTLSQLSDDYWQVHYLAARRVTA
ncbi:MAG: NlpC/P60 family protein [Silvania sp.]